MKIYNKKPEKLVRIQISRQEQQTHYITFCETSLDEVVQMCYKLLGTVKVDAFASSKKVSIMCREAEGGINLKSKSISFRGLSTIETYNLIINYVNSEESKKIHAIFLKELGFNNHKASASC